MKKYFLMAAAALMGVSALAQPQLSKDNIDEVLAAMTLQEKATLLVGGARAAMVNGVTSGTAHQVPGAAGNTRPIERLGIPGTVRVSFALYNTEADVDAFLAALRRSAQML